MMAGTASPVDQDVLIVGAGISGIGMAVHLQMHCPDRSFALAERRGGTVINADAMQTYDAFPILTAQPTEEERGRVLDFVGRGDPAKMERDRIVDFCHVLLNSNAFMYVD